MSATPPEKRIDMETDSLREHQRMQQRVDDLKDRVRRLIETPLFMNAELLKHGVIEDGARILQIVHKQPGIYGLLRASQVNQRKCLQGMLEK